MTEATRHVREPLPVLAITLRAPTQQAVDDAKAALLETSRQLNAVTVGEVFVVDHGDASVVELCLPIESLPAADPPPPLAAEVLVPGTVLRPLGAGGPQGR